MTMLWHRRGRIFAGMSPIPPPRCPSSLDAAPVRSGLFLTTKAAPRSRACRIGLRRERPGDLSLVLTIRVPPGRWPTARGFCQRLAHDDPAAEPESRSPAFAICAPYDQPGVGNASSSPLLGALRAFSVGEIAGSTRHGRIRHGKPEPVPLGGVVISSPASTSRPAPGPVIRRGRFDLLQGMTAPHRHESPSSIRA